MLLEICILRAIFGFEPTLVIFDQKGIEVLTQSNAETCWNGRQNQQDLQFQYFKKMNSNARYTVFIS